MWVRTLMAAALALAISSCGETNMQAIKRLTPQYRSKREQLWRIASRLPPPGSVKAPWRAGPMSPPLLYQVPERQFNTEILMAEQLADPDVEIEGDDRFDAILSRALSNCLRWTGPKNPLDPSVHDDRGDLGKMCEAAYAFPYLVVLRTVEFKLPEVLRLEVFVVDLRSEQLLASAPLAIRSRYTEADLGRGPWAVEARGEAYTAFFVKARCDVMTLLAGLPGARVGLDHECPQDPAFAQPLQPAAEPQPDLPPGPTAPLEPVPK